MLFPGHPMTYQALCYWTVSKLTRRNLWRKLRILTCELFSWSTITVLPSCSRRNVRLGAPADSYTKAITSSDFCLFPTVQLRAKNKSRRPVTQNTETAEMHGKPTSTFFYPFFTLLRSKNGESHHGSIVVPVSTRFDERSPLPIITRKRIEGFARFY